MGIKKFNHITFDYFLKNEENLTDKDYVIWDFMVTANIEYMTYKNDEKDSICIKLNSIMFF